MAEDVVGLRYVSEGLPEMLRGIQQYTGALNKVGQAEQKASQGATKRESATKGTTQADQQATRQQKAHEAALKRKAAAEAKAARETEQARRGLQQMQAAIDPVVAAQQRMENAQRRVDAAVRKGIITQKQGRQTLAQYQATMQNSDRAASGLRDQMLATANSIAILDGPLGGVASRFSAFGVLVGRTGVLLGGLLVSMAALGTVLGRSVQQFVAAERSMLRLQGVLEATGGAAGLAAEEIEGMAQRVASSTLASVAGTRDAATALLTFRSVTGDVFGEVLMLAQDMAELGFGTVRSEAVKLAKAIEDPRQSLTSLSRSGVTFTLRQRKVIQSLVETGREAEATARILGVVSSQVGGAGARAAEGFAGSLDSIAQAIGNISEQVGSGALDLNLTPLLPLLDDRFSFTVGDIISALGRQAAEFNAQFETASPATRLKEIRQELERLQGLPEPTGFLRFSNVEAKTQERIVQLLMDQATAVAELAKAREDAEKARRDKQRNAVSDLEVELEQREAVLNLTEREAKVREELGKIGLRGDFADGSELAEMQARAVELIEALFDTKKQQDFLRGMDATLASLRQQNTEAEIMNRFMGQSTNEAQALAEQEVLLTRLRENGVGASSRLFREMKEATDEAVRLAREADSIQAGLDSSAGAASGLASEMSMAAQEALNFVNNLGGGSSLNAARARVAGLRAELGARQSGAGDVQAAGERARAEIMARPEFQLRLQGPVNAREDALRRMREAIQTAEAQAQAGQVQSQIRDLSRPPRSGGSGGGADRTETLQDIVREMDEQIKRERQIIGLTRQETAALEIKFDIIDQLRSAEIPFQEERVAGIAEAIAAQQELNERLREQQETAEELRGAFADTFADAITGAKSFQDALGGLVQQLNKMLLNKAFGTIFSSIGGGEGGFLDTLGAALTPNADGNAFSNGRVTPFASGGVVNRPTAFPMANGAGLMGEDGPEAIMPLTRVNGKLGVQSNVTGGGGVVNNITVNAPPGSDVQEERRQNSTGGEDLTIMIDRAVSGLVRNPGSNLSRALRTDLGVGRATRSR